MCYCLIVVGSVSATTAGYAARAFARNILPTLIVYLTLDMILTCTNVFVMDAKGS